ncbi:MAG: hypothetical protein KAI66_21065, partial [Lentisphaeria bacterium]|nr:hypothetical protein [Lentisphaeria bacterium]
MSSHVPAILLLSLILAQILPQHLVGAEGESSLSQKWSYLKGHRLGTSLREQFQHGPQFPVDSLTRGLREGALGVKSHMTVAEMREVVNEAMKRYVQAKQSAVSASSDGAVVQAPKAESASPAEVSFRESVGYVTGRTTLYVRSWKDIDDGDLLLVSPQTGAASAYTLAYSYTSVDTGVDNPDTDDARPRTLTESIAGTVVSRTYHVYAGSLSSGIVHIVERAADNSSSYGATGNLRTTITYYPSSAGSASAGRVKTIRFPDGRLDTYVYESGVYSDSVDPSLCSFSAGAGHSLRATVTHGTVTYPAGIANRTTRERSVLDAAGNQVMDETHVFSGGTTYERIGWTVWVYDARGRLTHTYRSNGTEAQVEWDCCGKSRDVFADGTDYTYVHDEVGRVEITIKENADDPDIIQTHTRNGAGAILSTVTVADNTTLALSTSSTRDLTGRATQRVDPAGVTTTTVYDDTDNKTTVTNAAGGAAVVQRYVSGQTKSVTGTAVTDAYYDYGVDATTGHRWTCIYAGEMPASNDFTDIPMWTKTWTDVLGRTFKVEVPDPTDGTAVSQSYFNALGRLVRTTVPGKADAIYEYNELGELTRVGLDIDDDGDLTEASLDRIADTDTVYEKDASNVWWLKTTSAVFPTDNSSTDVTVSTTRARLTGLGSTAPTAYSGILAAESSVEDIHGNITVSR